MPINRYDDALEDLEEQDPAPAPRSVYDDVLADESRENETRVRTSLKTSEDITPDQAARARELALKFGVPSRTIARDLKTWEAREALEQPFGQMQTETPVLSSWLEEPENAAVAKDDLENLGTLEWLVTAPQRAYRQGAAQVEFAKLRNAELFRTLTADEGKRLETLRGEMKAGGANGAGTSWFRQSVTGAAAQLPNLFGATVAGLRYGIPAGVTAGAGAALLGQAGPQVATPEEIVTVPAAFGAGMTAGTMAGAAEFGFQVESGLAFEEFLEFKDEAGQPIGRDAAKAAALAAGALNAGLEAIGLGVLAKSIPGVEKLTGTFTRSAIREALRVPTVRAALAGAVASYGKTLGSEVSVEVAQRAITILSGELGKVASGQSIPTKSPTDVAQDLYHEAVGAAQAFSLLSLPGPASRIVVETRRANKAQQNVAFFTALGEGATASKTIQRQPEAARAFLERATKDGPIATVYAPVDTFVTYWQQQGLDPATVAEELTGDPAAFATAQQTGEDLAIPTARYATRLAGTNHNAFFVAELRLGPGEMNGREAEVFLAEQAAAAGPAAEADPGAAVQARIQQSLVATGMPAETAAQNAALWGAAFGALGQRAGVDPIALFEQYGLRVERPELARPGTVDGPGTAPEAGAAETGAQEVDPAGQADGLDEIAGFADLAAAAGDLELLEAPTGSEGVNASGESAASLEALSRQAGMMTRGESFVVYDRAGTRRPLLGPDAVDYRAQRGEAYGIEGPDGFRVLEDRGGKLPEAGEQTAGVDTEAAPVASSEEVYELEPETGDGGVDRGGERGRADAERSPRGAGEGAGAQRRRLPSPDSYPLEAFTKADADADAARLTAEVRQELGRIADELDEFPFVERTWSWLTAEEPNDGNAAGGKANIVEGAPGAPVYDDVLQFAPLNKGRGTALAKQVNATRAEVAAAIRKALETGRIHNNLAEGAVRVAERRAADDYTHLSRPLLPPSWGVEATPAFLADVDAAIEAALEARNLSAAALEEAGGDPTFDPTEYEQSLFDVLEEPEADPVPYPVAGAQVDGRTVRSEVPNTSSIAATLTDYTVLEGVRDVPLTAFENQGPPTFYSPAEQTRTETLAAQIAESGEIAPLIVAVDKDGPYILEGGHRFDALKMLGAQSLPALVVIDNEAPPTVDTLDTGEQQPRLPVAGAVREQEVATPELDAPFALTSEVSKAKKGTQTTLFQPLFHGSPHDVDRFSLEKVGTGEGAAAYGWGLYFAENPEVAAGYFDRLSGDPQITRVKLGTLRFGQANDFNYSSRAHVSDLENIRATLAEDLLVDPLALFAAGPGGFQTLVLEKLDQKISDYATEWPEGLVAAQALRAELAKPGAAAIEFDTKTGGVYQIEIADEHIPKMLDWDAPIDKQPQPVKDLVRAELKALGYLRPKDDGPRVLKTAFRAWVIDNGRGTGDLIGGAATGSSAYGILTQAEAEKLSAEPRAKVKALEVKYPSLKRGGGTAENPAFHGADAAADFKEFVRLKGEIAKLEAPAAEYASKRLLAAGVPGLRYFDGGSRDTRKGTRNVVVFDESIITLTHKNGAPVTAAERKEFFQSNTTTPAAMQQDARGSIVFGTDRQFTINLFARADLSTFLHESGHFFLEVFGDLAAQVQAIPAPDRTPDQARLVADLAAIDAFVGRTPGTATTREQHETFARAFEAYLLEGKAPSLELRQAFARFRAWLLGVYRSLRGLNVTLTPEVRAVFDRMLATDAAIEQSEASWSVEPLFLSADAAGMSPAEFELYRTATEDASRQARETLERKLVAEVQREQEAAWKAQRETIRAEVEQQAQQAPVYVALAAIRTGLRPDGEPLEPGAPATPLKLSKAIIARRYGADRLGRLPRPYVYTPNGGLDPDVVAQQFGFSSGDALLEAIETTEPLAQAVEREVNRRMLETHGSMLLDGTIHEQADAAVANESREQVVRAELRALAALQQTVDPFVRQARREAGRERAYERRWLEAEARLRIAIAEGRKQIEIDRLRSQVDALRAEARGGAATIRAGIPDAGTIREAARARVAGTRLGDLTPASWWHASRRAARKAIEAAARQDFGAAIKAKTEELLNLALYREGERVREDLEARVKKARDLGKPAARARLGLAGESYQDQIDGILDRFEFAPVPAKALERRASVLKWVASLEGEGLPVDLPEEVLNDARRVNYRQLTTAELVGVLDGIDQILHLSRLKTRLLKAAERRELEQVATGLGESIRANTTRTPPAVARDRRASAEKQRTVADWFAGHRKLASLLREMDGFTDGGAAWSAIMRPLNEAADREATMTADATRRFATLIETAFPGRAKRDLYVRQSIPAVGRSMSRMERIVVALNWGNEGNRDRVRRSEKWSDTQVQAVLDTLTPADARFVAGVFEFLQSYWPEIEAKQKRVYGIAPEQVAPVAFTVNGAPIAGGYFPLKYDDRLSARALGALDLEAANLAKQAAYANATTKRNHTQARATSVNMPVRLDFGVMFEHVGQVVHDLTHHEALIDVGRILGHSAVQQAILETHGDLVYRQIRNTIRDVAFGDIPATNGFERAVNHVRMGATVAGLGWNVVTSALQPLGLANSIVRIGPRWVAKGVGRWLRSPTAMNDTVAWIHASSEFMRNRARTQQREINEIRNSLGVNTGRFSGFVEDVLRTTTFDTVTKQGIADSYFWMIQKAQQIVDVPTWLGAYEKAMQAGETEARSIAMADQAVLDSQGGGQMKDLAQVQRGGPMMRLWTNFYSFFNVLHNQAVESHRRTRYRNAAEVGRLATDYLLLFVAPAVLGYGIREALRPGEGDDEEALAWRIPLEVASYLSGTMLGLRELSGALQGFYGYEGPAGARAFAALSRLGQQAKQGELDAAFFSALNDVAGTLFHYPAGQVRRTLGGIAALDEGKTDNPLAVITGPPRK